MGKNDFDSRLISAFERFKLPHYEDQILYRYCWVPKENLELLRGQERKYLQTAEGTRQVQSWTSDRKAAEFQGKKRDTDPDRSRIIVSAMIPGKSILAETESLLEGILALGSELDVLPQDPILRRNWSLEESPTWRNIFRRLGEHFSYEKEYLVVLSGKILVESIDIGSQVKLPSGIDGSDYHFTWNRMSSWLLQDPNRL
jgi:hypothetical protein